MKRIITVAISLLITAVAFCEPLRIGVLNGPTCIPAAYLMENNVSANFETFADPQALLPKMIKNEIDIGFMPLNVAAKVYNSGNKAILCAAVTGLGNLKVITTDKNLHTFSSLKGKTVYTAGEGATPEYMLRYILDENQLTYAAGDKKADVTIDFSIPTAQLAAQLISGKIKYAVVPEPFATIALMKSDSVIAALDLQKEYQELTGSQNIYPLSVMVVRKDFAENNPEQLEAFLQDYKTSYEWTINNPTEASLLCEKHKLGLAAGIVEKAIPVSNYTYIPAKEAASICEELLNIFLKNEASSIGGKLPDSSFYYEPENKTE